ncbi:MAG: AMP-binding protein [Lachnospiraceae bacterium]|nr:AMP-binding protein [Lachnospiraceae bacterium]
MYRNMLDFWQETIKRDSDKTALRHRELSLTFSELDQWSRAIANELYDRFPESQNRPIAVFLPKSPAVYACDIGITYSSNFFSNLDIKTPIERISNILELMKPLAILTDDVHLEVINQIPRNDIPILNISEIPHDPLQRHQKELERRLGSQIDTDPFCIINTSGSTGTPKGVVLNHRSFFDFMQWSFDTFGLDGSEIVGALSPVVFDIYDFELCLMMIKGATIVLLDAELAAFPVKLLEEMQKKEVNFIFWVPTVMVNIANMGLLGRLELPRLKTVWFAGEVFPTKQFNIWKQHFPNTIFANLYGPIEITLDCVFYRVDKDFKDDEPLPIGVPCHNTDILILNTRDQLCQENEEGELCVRGTSLAMGYYNNPEKTAVAFVQNPLNHSYPELIYRTGDIVWRDEEGVIHFKGRKDSLIKHMGYRIELGEVEHVIVNKLKLVSNCCAVYDFGKKQIVLFYEKREDVVAKDIRANLVKVFPRYMVPDRYEEIEELPRNTNGKIDRLKLSNQINSK